MKHINHKQVPEVSGGYRPGDGGCVPGPNEPFPALPFPVQPDPTIPCEPAYPTQPVAMLGELQ